eukprot:31134_1
MSYLQKGHVEKSFYERSSKSYLDAENSTFLATANKSFLNRSKDAFLSSSSDSFLAANLTNKSYLDSSNTSFLAINNTTSHIEPTNKSFVENSATSYLSLVKPSAHNTFLEFNDQNHVTEIHAAHLDEDRNHHLEESGGETSDEEKEDFSHAVDWSLVIPPYISPLFRNGATMYKCALTGRIFDTIPSIPERFDVFDFDVPTLIETIGRYHTNRGVEDQDGAQKYRALMKRKNDLHSTELQSQALEALRVWKHKKEQEMLGQVGIQAADFSERTERMGVGDVSSGGAAERKKRREALKRKQEKERQQQLALKQRLKKEQHLKSQEELVQKKQMTQQRQRQQQQAMKHKREQQRREELQREKMRKQQAGERDYYVKVESRNMTQQRQQGNIDAMNRNVSTKRDEERRREQQRLREREQKENYVKVEQKNVSNQRKLDRFSNMQSGLEQNLDSQASFRANISQERSNRVQQQQNAQMIAAQDISKKRAEIDVEKQRKEAERLRKQEIKTFVQRINNLLAVKSAGIDFDEFGNEFYFKYNAEWNPEKMMGTSDLEEVFRAQGLSSTVQVIRGGMTRRAMSYKHYQKIRIVSQDVNDILTVLAISEDIDGAIARLRTMMNQKEEAKRREEMQARRQETERKRKAEAERQQAAQRAAAQRAKPTATAGYGAQTNYSQANNWGLPRGTRVRKTAQGRLFFVNDATKSTSWEDPRPLPRGWRGGKTPQGRKFYINDATKTTSWSDPRPPIRI